MKSTAVILFFGSILVSGNITGADMDSHTEAKIENFKKSIGFDRLPPVTPSASGIVVAWPNLWRLPGLGPDWQVLADTTWWEQAGGIRKQILGRGNEKLVFNIFIAQGGEESARNFLLDKVSQTTMAFINYVRGPSNLGTLSLVVSGHPVDSVAWYFSDGVFQIESYDTNVDILALAKSLQSLAETRVAEVAKSHAPQPESIKVNTHSAPVGFTVTAEIKLGQDPTQYLVDLEFDKSQVNILSQDGLEFALQGLKPGKATIKAHLVDKRTLTSSTQTLEWVFTP